MRKYLIFCTSGIAVLIVAHFAGCLPPAHSPEDENRSEAAAQGNKSGPVVDSRLQYARHAGIVVSCVQFSPDGKTVATSAYESTILLWNVRTGRRVLTFENLGPDVPMIYRAEALAFSPDGCLLASNSASYSGETIKLWNARNGKRVATFPIEGDGGVYSLAFSPDSKTLAVGIAADVGRVDLYQVLQQEESVTAKKMMTLKGHYNQLTSIAFSPDGKTLASAGWDGAIKLWDISSGNCISTLRMALGIYNTKKEISDSMDDHFISSIAFLPDGKTLVSGGGDNTVRLWDVSSGRNIAIFRGHNRPIISVACSPDGRTIASGGEGKEIRLWDVSSGTCQAVLLSHHKRGFINSISYSPDGKYIAVGAGRMLMLWKVDRKHQWPVEKGAVGS